MHLLENYYNLQHIQDLLQNYWIIETPRIFHQVRNKIDECGSYRLYMIDGGVYVHSTKLLYVNLQGQLYDASNNTIIR